MFWMVVNRVALKDRREDVGISQRELARRAKISSGYMSQLESGDRKTCGPAVANRISEALDSRMGAIFFKSDAHNIEQLIKMVDESCKAAEGEAA